MRIVKSVEQKRRMLTLSPAGYAQAFYSILYDLDMDIEYLSVKTE